MAAATRGLRRRRHPQRRCRRRPHLRRRQPAATSGLRGQRQSRAGPRRRPDERRCAGDDTIDGGDGDDVIYGDGNLRTLDDCLLLRSRGRPRRRRRLRRRRHDQRRRRRRRHLRRRRRRRIQRSATASERQLRLLAGCAGDDILNGGAGDDDIVGDSSRSLLDALFLGNGLVALVVDVLHHERVSSLPSSRGGIGVPEDPSLFERCIPGGNDTMTAATERPDLGPGLATTSPPAATATTSSSATSVHHLPRVRGLRGRGYRGLDELIDFLGELERRGLPSSCSTACTSRTPPTVAATTTITGGAASTSSSVPAGTTRLRRRRRRPRLRWRRVRHPVPDQEGTFDASTAR